MVKNKEPGKLPEKKFGKGTITASIFENEAEKDGKKFKTRSVQLQKSFLKDGNWESRKISLNSKDLLRTAFLLQMCAQHIEENPLQNDQEDELPEELEDIES